MVAGHAVADQKIHGIHVAGQPCRQPFLRLLRCRCFCRLIQTHLLLAPLSPFCVKDHKSEHMKELLRTTDVTVIAYAQALLQGEGIATFEMDVHMSVLDGSLGILPRRLMVRDQDLFMARSVMRDNDIDLGL